MTRRKASEIPKPELVKMIARLRGGLYSTTYAMDTIDRQEVDQILEETTFDDDLNETYSSDSPQG